MLEGVASLQDRSGANKIILVSHAKLVKLPYAILILLLLIPASADPQESNRELELGWKLEHNQAAIYEIFDAIRGGKLGEFWLLGCELKSFLGAVHTSDLPYRFLFRLPSQKIKSGSQWRVRETAFGSSKGPLLGGIAPLEITGAYTLKGIRKIRPEELLKIAHKNRKSQDAIEVGIIEGNFEVFRCDWIEGKPVQREKHAAAILTTTTVVRMSDCVILGGKFRWSGRSEFYQGIADPKNIRSDEACELAISEPLLELTKSALNDRISRSLEKSVRWLKLHQSKDGRFSDNSSYDGVSTNAVGSTALSTLALLRADYDTTSVAIQKSLGHLRTFRSSQTYDLALVLMVIETKYDQGDAPAVRGQVSETLVRESIAKKISREDQLLAGELATVLIERQCADGSFGYGARDDRPNLSSTHFALLGLKSASRIGVEIPARVWRSALSCFEKAAILEGELEVSIQTEHGVTITRKAFARGWPYRPPTYPYTTGSMTLGTLAALSVIKSELLRIDRPDAPIFKTLEDLEWGAIAWLKQHFSMRANQPEGGWWGSTMPFYYLYAWERAGKLCGIEKIEGHDWYTEGVSRILSGQKEDGRWEGPHALPVIDTAFAILFLKRATLPVQTGTGARSTPTQSTPSDK